MEEQSQITVKKETRNELQIRKIQKQGREKRLITWDEFLLEATKED